MVAVCPPPPKLGHFYLPRTVPLYLTPSLLSHLLNQISLWIPRWHWRVAFRRPLTLACSVCVPRSYLASWTTSPAAVAAAAVAAMTAGTTRGRTHNLKRPTAALPSISRVRVCDAVCFDAEFCVSSFFSAAVGEHPMTHINRPGALFAAFRCALPFHPGLGSDEYINLLRYIYTGSLDGDAMSPSGLVALQTNAVRLDLPILARLTAALQPDSGEPLCCIDWAVLRFESRDWPWGCACQVDPLPVSTHPLFSFSCLQVFSRVKFSTSSEAPRRRMRQPLRRVSLPCAAQATAGAVASVSTGRPRTGTTVVAGRAGVVISAVIAVTRAMTAALPQKMRACPARSDAICRFTLGRSNPMRRSWWIVPFWRPGRRSMLPCLLRRCRKARRTALPSTTLGRPPFSCSSVGFTPTGL